MFKKAVKRAYKWSFKWFGGSFSTLLATFLLYQKFESLGYLYSFLIALGIILTIYLIAIGFFYCQLVNELQTELNLLKVQAATKIVTDRKTLTNEKSYYGDCLVRLNSVFSKFHSLRNDSALGDIKVEDVAKALQHLCNKLKHIFEHRVHNCNYSVTIKFFGVDVDLNNVTDAAQLITVWMDDESYETRKEVHKKSHDISHNTCFAEVLGKMDDIANAHFLHNHLPADIYYKNSWFLHYGNVSTDVTPEERRKNWTLPFRSELVVPITRMELSGERKKQFLGYIYVDCEQEDGFHTIYDPAMLKGLADGIFDILKIKYNTLNSTNHEQSAVTK